MLTYDSSKQQGMQARQMLGRREVGNELTGNIIPLVPIFSYQTRASSTPIIIALSLRSRRTNVRPYSTTNKIALLSKVTSSL